MFSRAVRGQPYHVGPSMVGTWDKGARARAQRLVLFLPSESRFAFMGLRLFYRFFAWRESMKPLSSDLRLAFACAWCERLLLAAATRVAALFVFGSFVLFSVPSFPCSFRSFARFRCFCCGWYVACVHHSIRLITAFVIVNCTSRLCLP